MEDPQSLPCPEKKSKSGWEEVGGSRKHGILSLCGRRVFNDETGGWLDTGNYTIHLPASGNLIEGSVESQRMKAKWAESGSVTGTVSYLRKPPLGFE